MTSKLYTLALLTGALGLFSLAGCPQSQNTDGTDNTGGDGAGETSTQTVTNGGLQREFAVHIPKNYNASAKTPVVLLLHGTGENSDSYLTGAGWAAKADDETFIIVAPNALPVNRDQPESLTNPSLWDFAVLGGGEGNDVSFIDAALASVEANYNVDTDRVYCTGHSSGGGMTFLLGVLRSSKFAAIGVVASPFISVSQSVGIPLPTVYIQGTADPIVPIAGGDGGLLGALVPPLETTLSGWAAVLGCDATRTTASNDGGVEVSQYANCEGNVPFQVMLIDGQGHKWPGFNVPNSPAFVVGPSVGSLNATDTIWSFFQDKNKAATAASGQ